MYRADCSSLRGSSCSSGSWGKPESVEVNVSANIIKNVKSVVVPCTGGLRGIGAAVCAGIVAGCPEKELEILEEITGEQKVENEKDAGYYADDNPGIR